MTNRHLPSDPSGDPIADLRDLLEIEPAQTFASRVMRSTAGQTPGRGPAGLWTGLASIAAVVAVLIVAWTRYDPVPVPDVRTETLASPRLDTGASVGPDRHARIAAGVTTDSDAVTSVAAVPTSNAPATTRAVDDDLGVIWTEEESVALEGWLRTVQTRSITFVPVPTGPAPDDVGTFPLLSIHPLESAPLTIDTLQTRSPSEGHS